MCWVVYPSGGYGKAKVPVGVHGLSPLLGDPQDMDKNRQVHTSVNRFKVFLKEYSA